MYDLSGSTAGAADVVCLKLGKNEHSKAMKECRNMAVYIYDTPCTTQSTCWYFSNVY